MKKIIGSLLALPILLCIAVPVVFASEATISTMSGIVMHLQHYPSNAEKQVLATISQDDHATVGEKALASALMHMQHAIQGSDATALRTLMSDKQASHGERELADILLGISHKPSSSDMRRLKSLSGS
ncbi:MAG: hypothetical protein Q9M21_00030 [Mariprofundaceae bacterium]|nr:hypothetical protein [Mariprofundaceae bacterium]